MKPDKDIPEDAEYQDILDGLRRMEKVIDIQRYPGAAWSAPRPLRRHAVKWLAAAAAILLAVVLWVAIRPQPITPQLPHEQTAITAQPPERAKPIHTAAQTSDDMSIPGPSVAMQVPGVSLPSLTESGVAGWSLPAVTVSLPSFSERSANNGT